MHGTRRFSNVAVTGEKAVGMAFCRQQGKTDALAALLMIWTGIPGAGKTCWLSRYEAGGPRGAIDNWPLLA